MQPSGARPARLSPHGLRGCHRMACAAAPRLALVPAGRATNSRSAARMFSLPTAGSNPQLSGPSRDQLLHDLDVPQDMVSTGSLERDPEFLCLEQVGLRPGAWRADRCAEPAAA